ncbi:kinase-like protein [Sistotremastrum niveocremeum HHB9708]|uniref:Kinase-like protein n=1 Tax=Sistotremastrum niveocremeum HHB9708 TaxID=1314777 RepID=A0A164NXQ2_9AGAM|nr:kinase-like protein [Sistotremastrum niveocremeum HHB9708]
MLTFANLTGLSDINKDVLVLCFPELRCPFPLEQILACLTPTHCTPICPRKDTERDASVPAYIPAALSFEHGMRGALDRLPRSDFICAITGFHQIHDTRATYMPPEVVLQISTIGEKGDIWALGCTLFEIFFGERLIDRGIETNTASNILAKLGPLPDSWQTSLGSPNVNHQPDHFHHSSDNFWSQMRERYLNMDLKKLGDPLLMERDASLFIDMMRSMLQIDPSKRISSQDLVEHDWFKLDGEPQDREPKFNSTYVPPTTMPLGVTFMFASAS